MADTDSKTENPPSLAFSANPSARVQPNKPKVKPPLKDVPMGRFLTYLTLGLVALIAFYTWRLTVWANNVGGYWNLMTGARPAPGQREKALLKEFAATAASSQSAAASSAGADSAVRSSKGKPKKESIEEQVQRLAASLGITPAQLSAAIRPFLDPTMPNPHDPAAVAAAAAAAAVETKDDPEPGILGVVGEILLD